MQDSIVLNPADEVLILGNPNSGKTLLFNRLTGLKAKVANFPGVTVEIRKADSEGLVLYDYPGIYSLKALTLDEKVAIDRMLKACTQSETRALVCVLDGTRLERSLYLLLQLRELSQLLGLPLVGAINVIDEVLGAGRSIDLDGLKKELGIPIFALSAKNGSGLSELKNLLAELSRHPQSDLRNTQAPRTLLSLEELRQKVSSITEGASNILRFKSESARLARAHGPSAEAFLKVSNRIDSFFLSTWGGPPVFALIMIFLFQAIFSWSAPLMDFIDSSLASFGEVVSPHIGQTILRDFFNEAFIAGLGSFLVFAPQIFVLFLIIGLLEDSGYLARAAIILHRPLSWVGLSGRSFVPLLSGHACAIPAMMATRMIESPRKRLLTLLVVPFTSCSARLPVYALLVGGFVPATALLGGLIDLRGFAFFGLFALGIITAVLSAAILNKLLDRTQAKTLDDAPFIVELPPYRWPSATSIIQNAASKTWGFIYNAGFVIFMVTVVVWILGYFPAGSGNLESSWLASLGKFIEPLVAPLGMDWKIGVAILTSFLAREVFVGTLGTLYGLEAVEDNLTSLSERLTSSGMTLPTAVALLVFYALAMQCVSTLAVMKKETGSLKIPLAAFGVMTLIAYVGAGFAYWILS